MLLNFPRPVHPLKSGSGPRGDEGVYTEDDVGEGGEEKEEEEEEEK